MPFPFVEEGRSFRSAEALRYPKSSARPELFSGLRRGEPRLYGSFLGKYGAAKAAPLQSKVKIRVFPRPVEPRPSAKSCL